MAQQLMVFTTKPNALSSFPIVNMIRRDNQIPKFVLCSSEVLPSINFKKKEIKIHSRKLMEASGENIWFNPFVLYDDILSFGVIEDWNLFCPD